MDFSDLPDVPVAQRPKKLYVEARVDATLTKKLAKAGWEVVDVRLIQERPEYLRALTEGASFGSLILSEERKGIVELEAKMLGLFKSGTEKAAKKEDWLNENDPDKLIASFGKKK